MCAEYAKRVLQGGLQMLPQKHKEASVCVYKSGFFMTTNKMPYFGEGPDAEAISTSLAVFDTQPLPQVRHKVDAQELYDSFLLLCRQAEK